MNCSKLVALICLILFGIMPSCVKNSATIDYTSGNANQHLIPLNPVKKGEPFIISAVLPDSNASVRWTIRPSDSTQLNANGNRVMITITFPGMYLITVNFYSPSDPIKPYDSSTYSVTVTDTNYTQQVGPGDTVSLAGGEVTLIPVSTSGTLEFIVQTAAKYNCTSSISAIGFNQYIIGVEKYIFFYFDSAMVDISKADCGGIKNPATIIVTPSPLANGIHTIYGYLNQFMYEGSVNVTDSNYTFTWPYTSGLIISPMQLKK
jgi:hypothetical protein